jgi:hypothetical protein
VYDDKLVIYYNLKGGKQVSYMEMCDDMETLASDGDGAESLLDDEGDKVRISHNLHRHSEQMRIP